MKKLILIFGAFALTFVMISALMDTASLKAQSADVITQTQLEQEQKIYTVKSENGRIVVYYGDELIQKTSTAVNTLPKKDQKTLLYGITVNSKEEVELILQDYCS
ncbi:MAG: BofC C-terminal domain-containing protein [Ruminococcus sp.]|nr:BofC C-terminal domain-containing protein [Ruminococcus sp.]